MKITKRQLKRIIKEECGMSHDVSNEIVDSLVDDLTPTAQPVVVESIPAEQELVIEMEVASRALTQVVESVQNAAQLCSNCHGTVAMQAPLVEAMVTQAEALQEMLEAQVDVIHETADNTPVTPDVIDISSLSM